MTRIVKHLFVSALALGGFALMASETAGADDMRVANGDNGTRVKGYELRQQRGGYSYV